MVFGFIKKKKEKKELKSEELRENELSDNNIVNAQSLASDEEVFNKEQSDDISTAEIIERDAREDAVKGISTEAPNDNVGVEDKKGYFSKLKAGLAKTGAGFGNLFLGKKAIDDELLEDLETALLMADVGIEATQEIIDDITDGIARKSLNDQEAVVEQLKLTMRRILAVSDKPLVFEEHKPFVLMMVGINGAGKTTTIGKIAEKLKNEGKSVMLAAGDTFRAAAVEQLKTWGERAGVPVVSQGTGADSASVIYDAYESAKAKGIDVLIADTAGRLHTQKHLMSEIEKIVRVLRKHDPETPHEVMLVVDAGNGQNALNQAKEFDKSLGLTGITVTKLDGTAKGGIIFPIAKQLGVPVRFIGVGESAADLRTFNAKDFVDALLADLSKD
ncbi:MAG: signal recognition particle-docking protein FtsY [Gammaproteobacteria bacterium]|nr:signal recognition particle-docking protein FtsY [Gammaproteobacteria bacterium]